MICVKVTKTGHWTTLILCAVGFQTFWRFRADTFLRVDQLGDAHESLSLGYSGGCLTERFRLRYLQAWNHRQACRNSYTSWVCLIFLLLTNFLSSNIDCKSLIWVWTWHEKQRRRKCRISIMSPRTLALTNLRKENTMTRSTQVATNGLAV